MDDVDLLARLREDHETALSRLGSSKALYALTGGEMNPENVRAAAAAELDAAADLYASWAADEDDPEAVELFEDLTAAADDLRESLGVSADVETERPAVYETLGALTGSVERVAGTAAYLLVLGKTAEQLVGFFIGDADPRAADDFRSLRTTVEELRDDAAATLDAVCDDDAERDRAAEVADEVVEAAYDDYVETLESMGVKPKNVC